MSNEMVLLDSILSLGKQESGTKLNDSEYFEFFCCEQVLKNYDLSYDEIQRGLVGAGDDGGIDGFFALIEGELLDEDTDLNEFRKSPEIDLVIIQSKQSPSFAEQPLDRLISTCSDIFDLDKPVASLQSMYNSMLLRSVEEFRNAYVTLSARHGRLKITCVYAAKGDTSSAHPKVNHKCELLQQRLSSAFASAAISIVLLGARELIQAAQQQKTYTLSLRLIDNPISTGEGAYVALANLRDYGAFVTDGSGRLRKYIFESNVRDYQGDVDVNEDIRRTLEEPNPRLNFWWLNNGITILATKATIAAKTITLDEVQIVNGLQTTTTLHNYLTAHPEETEVRSVLLKIIETSDAEARDRIIKATNYQTAIPPASLKATDRIQRDLETFLLQHGWFYDRRKNFYKNQGKPLHQIIGIPYLAQAVMAIVLREPDNSRARPSTLIKNQSDYRRVFNEKFSFDIYLASIKLMKVVDELAAEFADRSRTSEDIRNFRFHVAMVYAIKLLKKNSYDPTETATLPALARLDLHSTAVLFEDSISEVLALLESYQGNTGYTDDRIAKSREFVLELLDSVTPGLSPLTPERLSQPDSPISKSGTSDDDIPF